MARLVAVSTILSSCRQRTVGEPATQKQSRTIICQLIRATMGRLCTPDCTPLGDQIQQAATPVSLPCRATPRQRAHPHGGLEQPTLSAPPAQITEPVTPIPTDG